MISSAIAAMLLMGAVPEEIRVDKGRVDLSTLPGVEVRLKDLPTPDMVERVERILAGGACRLPGQSDKRFDIDVPYAVLLQPDGSASRVVVADMGCPELESLAGRLVLQLAREREFVPGGNKKARWFGNKLNFNLQ